MLSCKEQKGNSTACLTQFEMLILARALRHKTQTFAFRWLKLLYLAVSCMRHIYYTPWIKLIENLGSKSLVQDEFEFQMSAACFLLSSVLFRPCEEWARFHNILQKTSTADVISAD